MYGVTPFGTTVKMEHLALADKLIELKNTQGPWEVMDAIVEAWAKTRPTEYKSLVIEINDTKENTYNEFGESEGGRFRRTIDLPVYVERMFRILYQGTDFQFDKKFYRQVWKRYPIFRVSKRS